MTVDGSSLFVAENMNLATSSSVWYFYTVLLMGTAATVWVKNVPYWQSLRSTPKVSPYGVYTEAWQMPLHFLYLVIAPILYPNREVLSDKVSDLFRGLFRTPAEQQLPASESNEPAKVLVTHSCRGIFYGVLTVLLDEQEQKTGRRYIRIATHEALFNSFQKLITTWDNGEIDFYLVSLNEDFTLGKVDERELKSCHLVLCQHAFGVPLLQDELFRLGRKHKIPVLEDCVQSGSLYGKYQGHSDSDVAMWSGGLDKIPNCMGGGLALFRETPLGQSLYKECKAWHDSLPVDTLSDRSWAILSLFIHVCIAKNTLNILPLVAFIGTRMLHPEKRLPYVLWHELALAVRQDKRVTPFQHAVKKFVRQPSRAQLMSIKFGLQRREHYEQIAAYEDDQRKLLLSCTPEEHHTDLFPWWTSTLLKQLEVMGGVSEFTWVATRDKDHRQRLLQYMSVNNLLTMENTTWQSSPLFDRLVYLPNLNQMTPDQVRRVGAVLTEWCRQEYKHDGK